MKRKKRMPLYIILLLSFIGFLYFENNAITISKIEIESDKLPEAFDNFKIVQLSDLHNKSFGKEQKYLIDKIRSINPDIILFTGDLVDANRYNEEPSLELMKETVKIAPVYHVTGNHEWCSGKFGSLEEKLKETGVKVLRNTHEVIDRGQGQIYIAGIDDPEHTEIEEGINIALKGIESNSFKILLSHRPELFNLYSQYGFDLIFSGHAHGGQFRLPFIGGLAAPDQGLFPKYTSGKYSQGSSVMVVNRGLGNSIIPQRIFNRPEIVVAVLKSVK